VEQTQLRERAGDELSTGGPLRRVVDAVPDEPGQQQHGQFRRHGLGGRIGRIPRTTASSASHRRHHGCQRA
jgi:hypothetical protein